ncbi:DNA damage-regulated autophagy modulator protein 2-like [Mercenaria mercenaria]|uniref:DNA damage-regulated autophagy modulator protein 2-like n=1 Tax=Mercenaria mercenaria TaxID=6596 RepID=UPI00234F6CD4|nr:DNA damage-regulated autophagy modulator protein 2-like [Mercenaria mercenaria]XP_053385054.1 DNA damage-regulated autophagy modulator protein 2-like [Mercenaria mercenaria]XP_053385055.1 DNA damage-regulated autophagy modulator protein 2-like [Mercenaria mercenaria]XP_053385056.1 DNA damage-regulated autophagy modulator protein 2-like [Mercenaria mercenaria]XP_053385057.1 DNA damage-regulated autophagy modulator protein 2-like [Mercenaria mercenaria]XP_053385058.1 DNA damage-regulated auto
MSILCLVALKRRLWLLPILTSGWLFTSFWTAYAIAVSYDHTDADFPYISHTAIEAPERCVFGQMVNIGAVMLGMNVILRYLFCKKYLRIKLTPPEDRWYKINFAGLVLGILTAVGLSLVANFQTEVHRVPHYVGAGLAFGLGTVYCWFQTALTYQARYKYNRKKIVLLLVQFINSVMMSMLLVLFGTTKLIYKVQEMRGKGSKWDELNDIYLTSTITEWLLALSILTFTLTYAPDFKNMRVDDPNIYFKLKFEKKHSSVNLQKMTDNNSNIQGADVKRMEEGRANEDNKVTKCLSVVSNGTT